MLYRFDEKTCLNGWWKILPEYDSVSDNVPPISDCEEREYLVPSFYNRLSTAVKMKGESYYTSTNDIDRISSEDADLIFDTYGYPGKWTRAKSVWIMRTLDALPKTHKQYFLMFEGAGPVADLYVNGNRVCHSEDMTLPFSANITKHLKKGQNEIAVHITDYPRTEYGKAAVPCGGITADIRGIWQDVYLIEKDDVYIQDITVVTSVRNKIISVKTEIRNESGEPFVGTLKLNAASLNADSKMPHMSADIAVPTGESAVFSLSSEWTDPLLWDNFDPNLYMLTAELLSKDGAAASVSHERFGFREIWIEGEDLILNGHPIHLFSDWGHRVTLLPYTKPWVEKWFGMIRDYNMNHSRLHTGPHPEMILEMADEAGIFITDETALFGSGDTQGASSDAYWQAAEQHVRNFVARDKNHPCLLLWSCENEMRWLSKGVDKCRIHLPELRQLFNRLDPTRPAYHEGDSSLWNENEQDLVSRHYGKDCTGLGWWDHKRPLHSGEMGLFHYAGPNNTVQFGGDRVWTSQALINSCAIEETALTVNDARLNGVCDLGPWNFSCHLNLRDHKAKKFRYDDYTAPGIKPLKVNAGTAEFVFWKKGKGYIRATGSEQIPFMFRPFAALEKSLRASYFSDKPIEKTFTFVNDTRYDVKDAVADVCVSFSGGAIHCKKRICVKRGCRTEAHFSLSGDFIPGAALLKVKVTEGRKVLDKWEKPISLDTFDRKDSGLVYVLGDGSAEGLLQSVGAQIARVNQLSEVPDSAVCVIERNYIHPGSTINKDIQALCGRGGRVILLSQSFSAFPSIKMEEKPLQSSFIRDHDSAAIKGLFDRDLRFWGDDAYSLLSGDTYVVNSVYQKDTLGRMEVIVDSGEGNFGDGDLESAVMFCTKEGRGAVYACQLLLCEKYQTVAAAGRIMSNLLKAAREFNPEQGKAFKTADPGRVSKAIEWAKEGNTVLIENADENAIQTVARSAGIQIKVLTEPEGTYNCIKAEEFPFLQGLSNADLSGIERVSYCPGDAVNVTIADRVMDFAEGLTPVLVTAPESCQRPYYVYGCASELLRANVATKYCIKHEEPAYVVMGSVKVGKGTVYLSTFRNTRSDRPRLDRLYRVLSRQLSGSPSGDGLLDGDCARDDRPAGKGCPEKAYITAYNAEQLDTMLKACAYCVERMNPRQLLDTYPFTQSEMPNGQLKLKHGRYAVYFTVYTMRARKQEDLGQQLPDPMAQTFMKLDLNGCSAEVYINGAKTADLPSGIHEVSDINLERGLNHALLIVDVPGDMGSLAALWHNILGEAENGFAFN